MTVMWVETKYLRLFREARLGDQIDGWRVCWLGGWDRCRVVFVVMVERVSRDAKCGRGSPREPMIAAPRRTGA
jgi:hypothetical protein